MRCALSASFAFAVVTAVDVKKKLPRVWMCLTCHLLNHGESYVFFQYLSSCRTLMLAMDTYISPGHAHSGCFLMLLPSSMIIMKLSTCFRQMDDLFSWTALLKTRLMCAV